MKQLCPGLVEKTTVYMQYAMTIYVEPALPRVVPNLPLPLLLLIVKILEHKRLQDNTKRERSKEYKHEGTKALNGKSTQNEDEDGDP